ncbi:fungal-specific transcription factor domain-containing protein [Dactylonectria estremocensis]|uniref:Fungal-specific transcription factor domain-containing protein n=1 Tax=Dactylonectria estremocensis TaxID=1079267 RepID=A0A9P9DJJ6_9HYPO|nr:fungal-specific transcription factor domain-containing protein [Dactylonectria estremocensis]
MTPPRTSKTSTRVLLPPRSKSGCFTCRRRHKKCDEVRPECAGCVRNQLICHWPAPSPGTAPEQQDAASAGAGSEQDTDADACLVPVIIRQPTALPPLFRNRRNSLLFEHFAHVTSLQMASRVHPENAYLSYNLRIAAGFDGLQHAILAISASHVLYINSESTDSSLDHYVVALRGLTHAITKWKSSSAMDRILVVATSLALCQYEVLNANTQGSLYHHLRALKWMISEMLKNERIYDQDILGFFLEQYQYLAIVSHVGFGFGLQMLDWKPGNQNTVGSLTRLNKGSPIYGFMFGRSHNLFALIPRIHDLAQQCWQKEQPAGEQGLMYSMLQSEITSWEGKDDEHNVGYQLSGRIYQQSLLIYLHMAFHGGRSPTTGLIAKVEPCIELCLHYIESLPAGAHTWTTSMWPTLVSGSCMLLETQRNRLSKILSDSVIRFPTLEGMLKALILYWTQLDDDTDLYGPHGFEMTMKRHNIILCVG